MTNRIKYQCPKCGRYIPGELLMKDLKKYSLPGMIYCGGNSLKLDGCGFWKLTWHPMGLVVASRLSIDIDDIIEENANFTRYLIWNPFTKNFDVFKR